MVRNVFGEGGAIKWLAKIKDNRSVGWYDKGFSTLDRGVGK